MLSLPTGSYLLEVSHPDYFYEPVRVDINSKGKIRAREVNNVQPSQVTQVTYPLRFKPLSRHKFFQKREEFGMSDVLRNPMVWMMLLPLVLVTILPRMMTEEDTKRELEQVQQCMNVHQNLPEVSAIMANLFGSSSSRKKKPVRRWLLLHLTYTCTSHLKTAIKNIDKIK